MDSKTFAESVTRASTRLFNRMVSLYIAMGHSADAAMQRALEDEKRFIEQSLQDEEA